MCVLVRVNDYPCVWSRCHVCKCMYICTYCIYVCVSLQAYSYIICVMCHSGREREKERERTGERQSLTERERERHESYVQRINVVVLAKAIFPFLYQEVNRITCESNG